MTDLERMSDLLHARGLVITTAESCTAGLIAGRITDISGSSAIFHRGYITYSNDAKADMLNVSRGTLGEHGAVSPQCATEMAQGALTHSGADIAIAVTGIAEASKDTHKPAGLVYIAIGDKEATICHEHHFNGARAEVREATVNAALAHVIRLLEKDTSP